MRTQHTTDSCDLPGCDVIVDAEGDYAHRPDGWVYVEGMMPHPLYTQDQYGSKMFCSWAHAAEWVAKRAECETKEKAG